VNYTFLFFFLLQQEASISMESGIQSDHINNKIVQIKLNILTYSYKVPPIRTDFICNKTVNYH